MELQVEYKPLSKLIPYANNARTHSDEQVSQIAASIKEWAVLGDYAVSSAGVIVSLPHEYTNRWGGISRRPTKILSQSSDQDGYKLVTMKRLGWNKNGQYRAHRIVAHCWIGPCPEGMEVNHIDGCKSNNAAANLEYVTSRQNKLHAVKIGLTHTGVKHHRTKPVRLEKGGVEMVLNGVSEIQAKGFHAPSVHRAARGEREAYKGWRVSYV